MQEGNGGIKVVEKVPEIGQGVEDLVLKKPKFNEQIHADFQKVLKKLKIYGTPDEVNA